MKVSNTPASALKNAIQSKDMQTKDADVKKAGKEGMSFAKMASMGSVGPATVELSPEAKQIQKATEIAKNNDIDEAKIARLQSLIDNGKYQIDAAQIAEKLVDEHLKFPS